MPDPARIMGLLLWALATSASGAAPYRGPELEEALAALDRQADFYRDNALRFSCDETIVFAEPGQRNTVLRLEYIYVYENDVLADYRTLRRARRRDGPIEAIQPENRGLPFFLRRAYSWIFLFERAKWEMYHYEIIDAERMAERDALVIAFVPISPIKRDLNDWIGRAWVDAGDYRILKVEALKKEDHDQKTAFESALVEAPGGRHGKTEFVFTTITTEFDVEEKGVLLPGKVEATRLRGTVFAGKQQNRVSSEQLFRVTQTYRNYRFFGVETLDMFRGSRLPGENR